MIHVEKKKVKLKFIVTSAISVLASKTVSEVAITGVNPGIRATEGFTSLSTQ